MPKIKAERKPPKLPKSLGACVDLYHDMREKRLEENKVVEAMKQDEVYVQNYLIDNINKRDDGGAVGKNHKALVVSQTVYQVDDWDKLYAHIRATGSFELLNRALNQAAVAEHTDGINEKLDAANAKALAAGKPAKPRKMLPGVKTFTALKLSVTKV